MAKTLITPGAFHLPGWLNKQGQQRLFDVCREIAQGNVPPHSPAMAFGNKMSVKMVCAGWHWQPYKYSRVATNVNNKDVAPFPELFGELARAVVAECFGRDVAAAYKPDIAIINSYDENAKMGMHQDRDEKSMAPVVSLSLGNACVLRFGNTSSRNKPFTDVTLHSGDAFVFGGVSRLAFHGVKKTLPNTAPSELKALCDDNLRINVTIRESGLHD